MFFMLNIVHIKSMWSFGGECPLYMIHYAKNFSCLKLEFPCFCYCQDKIMSIIRPLYSSQISKWIKYWVSCCSYVLIWSEILPQGLDINFLFFFLWFFFSSIPSELCEPRTDRKFRRNSFCLFSLHHAIFFVPFAHIIWLRHRHHLGTVPQRTTKKH